MRKRITIYLIIISMFFTGCAGLETRDCMECAKGSVEAKYDADMDSQNENTVWAVAGGVLLPLGIAFAALYPVKGISPEKLAGKSREYVETYTKYYSSQYILNRVKVASIWCGVTSICSVAVFVAGIWLSVLTGF